MKKAVFQLNSSSDRDRQKVVKVIAGFPGIATISVNKDMKFTAVGDMDPVTIAINLRKHYNTDMISLGAEEDEELELLGNMRKAVFKLDIYDDRAKEKVMRAVSNMEGIESISMDMRDKKMTVIGDIDPIIITSKLRKLCFTEIISVGVAKKEKEKQDEPKKIEEKEVPEYVKVYLAFNPHMRMFKSAQEH